MLVFNGNIPTPVMAGRVLQGTESGAFGVLPLIPIAIAGGISALLGGGTLWVMHERSARQSDYLECVQQHEEEYNMSPAEAAAVCSGKVGGFRFGLNKDTLLMGGLLVSAAMLSYILGKAMK